MASDNRQPWEAAAYYNESYYEYYNGLGPYTREKWLPFFRHVAGGIIADSQPRTTIEFGCAKGFLVEALRDAGIDAWGIDWSPHAIDAADPTVQPYCRVGDIREPVAGRYDAAICMEVLEHLDARDASRAVRTLAVADTVYFSSNPQEDFPEDSHVNVQPPEYWEALFERVGMARQRDFDPHFIAPWALKFSRKPVEIVIPVYNSPRHVRWCLDSLYRCTDPALFHLLLVDDGSDATTRALLDEVAATRANVTLLADETNRGYLGAANRGLAESRAAHVVLLNSDTILTPGWLERLVAAAASDPAVGLVCPLSNRAENLSLPMPPGHNFLDTAALLAAVPPGYPEAITVVGYCLLITRRLLDAIGAFDPLFSPGYVEEADYQFRARAVGFRAVIADDAYVYHARGASFGGTTTHFRRNQPIFEARWGQQYREALARFDAADPLRAARGALASAAMLPPGLLYDVAFYLPAAMAGIGGMISVVELANRLILRGLRVAVAHPGPWAIAAECLFEPLSYADEAAFLAAPPLAKVLVATGYQTVEPILRLCRAYGMQPAYFIQDYEGYFDNARHLSVAAATYAQCPTRITVSRWLHDLIADQHGLESTIIPLGVAIDEFYPRAGEAPAPIREAHRRRQTVIFGVLRQEDRRGAPYLLELARRLEQRCPEVHFVFAGASAPPERPNITAVGLLGRDQLARYLSASDVAIDASLYHGFGMLAVEAMACGTAVILTDSGGCGEYARPGMNCLLTPPRDVRAMEEAVLHLHGDPSLRARLGEGGRATAMAFDWEDLADRHAAVYAPLGAAATLDRRRYAQLPRPAAADPAERPLPPPITLYQAFDGGDHFYTADPREVRGGGYRLEGPAFAVWPEPGPGLVPLHRFRHPVSGDHLYTADEAEGRRAAYAWEGIVGYIRVAPMDGLVPVFRAYHPRVRDHLYSLDPSAGVSLGYVPEGVLGYAPPPPPPPLEQRLHWLETTRDGGGATRLRAAQHRLGHLGRWLYNQGVRTGRAAR